MGVIDWLYNRPFRTPKLLNLEVKMDFATFINKYYNKVNLKTGKNWVIAEIAADSGLGAPIVLEWIEFAMKVQADMVKAVNRMPADDEIIAVWNKAHGITIPVLPPTTPIPVPPRDPATSVITPFGLASRATKPAGLTMMLQYSPDQFEELMHHILCEHDDLVKKIPAAPKAVTVNVPTDYQQQSILTWPFQKVIELWDALAHKG